MLPLSTTLTGTDVPRTNWRPKKNPKTVAMITAITIADLMFSLRRILVIILKVLPALLVLIEK